MANILNTGVSALKAFQWQLNTTGQNIANVNTEGYTRQSVSLGAEASETVLGRQGSGVSVEAVYRNYDMFLVTRARSYNSSQEDFSTYNTLATQVDSLIADADAGIGQSISDFFNAAHDVASDPTSAPARDVMLNRASNLADRFNAMDNWLTEMNAQVDDNIETQVGEINRIAKSIANINSRLTELGYGNGGNAPNDLLDERDRLLNELSGYTSVNVIDQDQGTMNVTIGNGQALVLGSTVNELGTKDNPLSPGEFDIVMKQRGGSEITITEQLSGGSIAGALRFRNEMLSTTRNELGLLAMGVASKVNEVHKQGLDLDGAAGVDFFSEPMPEVIAHDNNTAGNNLALTIDDVSELRAANYEMSYDGSNWTLLNVDTNATVPLGAGAGTSADPFIVEGMSIVVDGEDTGDRYALRPTRDAARTLSLNITDPRQIAAAGPGINAGMSNTGSSTAALNITDNTALSNNTYEITYGSTSWTSVPTGMTGSGTPADPIIIDGMEIVISGTPDTGDTYTIESKGIGDNSNIRQITDIRESKFLLGARATLDDAHGIMVSKVGTRVREAQTNAEVQGALYEQAVNARDAVGGVNLDEEAANLVRFQQAYQAAAQVFSTANTVFETLLGTVRN